MKHIVLATLVCFFASQAMAESELAAKYPGPWQTDYNQRITKTLTVNSISGCGQYKYKEDAKKRSLTSSTALGMAINGWLTFCGQLAKR